MKSKDSKRAVKVSQNVKRENRSRACAFTIVSKNYISLAATLAASHRTFHPDKDFLIVLVDRDQGDLKDVNLYGAKLLKIFDLAIPDVDRFIYRYSIMELNTAVKPYAFHDLIEHFGYDSVVYLDPDIRLYRPMTEVYEGLLSHDLILTPHMRAPYYSDGHPSDLSILQSGTYNLGFLAVKKSADVSVFLEWWMSKLYMDCVVEIEKGLFVDQKWVDLVPGFIASHMILRSPAYNVAYWNLHERQIQFLDGDWFCSGVPLVFFHFSGYTPFSPHKLSKHQNRYELSELPILRKLTDEYGNELIANGYEWTSEIPYAFATLSNGVRLPMPLVRDVMQWAGRNGVATPNPIAEPDNFCKFLMSRGVGGLGQEVVLLYHFLLLRRPDVARAYPAAASNSGEENFRNWVLTSGCKEEALEDLFPFEGSNNRDLVAELFERLREHRREDVFREFSDMWVDEGELKRFCDWIETHGLIELGLSTRHVNALMSAIPGVYKILNIYFLRGDLQSAFRIISSGVDQHRFINWLNGMQAELSLDSSEISLFKEFAAHSSVLLEKMRFLYQHFGGENGPTVSLYNVDDRRHFISATISASDVVKWLLDDSTISEITHFESAGKRVSDANKFELASVPSASARDSYRFVRGIRESMERRAGRLIVNLAGYLHAPSGMGESARSMASILNCLPEVATKSFALPHPRAYSTRVPADPFMFGWPQSGAETSILVANADAAPSTTRLVPNVFWGGNRIGFWVWETNRLPVKHAKNVELFDEIWTPSEYSAAAIRRSVSAPVKVLPHAIDCNYLSTIRADRTKYNFSDGYVYFGFIFDPQSVVERKNVSGLISAFNSAFREGDKAKLIIKVNGEKLSGFELESLVARSRNPNVIFETGTKSREWILGFIKSLDVYVSLHRSEGFGLTCAEAMALGVPTIASGYSGNLEFMDQENSVLVKVQEIETTRPFGPYLAGTRWGDPNLDHAAQEMRRLLNKDFRRELGARGASSIRRKLSPEKLSVQFMQLIKTSNRSRL